MTYATFATHVSPVVHYLMAFSLLFILLPKWLFSTGYVDLADRWFAAYVKMIFFLIISGYLLVLTKTYEVPSLVLLFAFIIAYRVVKREQGKKTDTLKIHLLNYVFNWLDGLLTFRHVDLKLKVSIKLSRLKSSVKKACSLKVIVEGLALLLIIGGASYLRFYDAFANAAPPMADSYVTLAWMKYIDARQLFHDGIYPQGFHIYLATLFKFAAVDAFYILRYTGPFNSVAVTLGLYIMIRKLTKSGIGAITAAFILGVLWMVIPQSLLDIERQAATNSQEFAFVFIYPAVYFFSRYFLEKRKEDLQVGLICTAIIGLVHSLAFAFMGILLGVLVMSAILTLKDSWKPAVHICIGTLLTVVLSLVPIGAGLLLGKQFHSSSAAYLIERKEFVYTYPDLTYIDYSALGLCVVLFLYLFLLKNTRNDRFVGLFMILAVASTFILYFGGGTWTQSTVIESRARELWGIVIPFCVGVSISYLFKWLKEKWHLVFYIPLILLTLLVFIVYKPSPIIPYKLEHQENIEQYMKIRNEYLHKTWMIVSQVEGYSVVLGTGYHMYLGDFLQLYRPDREALTRMGAGSIDDSVAQDVFIFMEKNLFQVAESNSVYELLKPEYARRNQEYTQLAEWMKMHKEAGFNVKTFFENENIRIYHLKIPIEDPLLLKNSWNR